MYRCFGRSLKYSMLYQAEGSSTIAPPPGFNNEQKVDHLALILEVSRSDFTCCTHEDSLWGLWISSIPERTISSRHIHQRTRTATVGSRSGLRTALHRRTTSPASSTSRCGMCSIVMAINVP